MRAKKGFGILTDGILTVVEPTKVPTTHLAYYTFSKQLKNTKEYF